MKYFYNRFSLTPMTKLRFVLNKCKYNLSDTVEFLKNDPNPTYLKSKRKSYGSRYQLSYKSTENIEFLKEVKLTIT